MRSIIRLPLVLLLVVFVASLGGCGSDDATSSSGDDAPKAKAVTTEGLVATVDAKLEIAIKNVGNRDGAGIPLPDLKCTRSVPATCSGTVVCPAATDDANGIELCGWLARSGEAILLAEEEPGQMCTQQYGGPEVATVTGTLGDEQVDATFSRQDGCAIGAFDAASPLWSREALTALASASAAGGDAASGSCPALPAPGGPDAPVSNDAGDDAGGAADAVCAAPTTTAPATAVPPEPEIISDPPEAFGK